jgi:hypothetical protein
MFIIQPGEERRDTNPPIHRHSHHRPLFVAQLADDETESAHERLQHLTALEPSDNTPDGQSSSLANRHRQYRSVEVTKLGVIE